MPKLGAVLETLLKKIGLDTTAPELAPLIALDTEVPDTVATKIGSELLTITAAKSHPEVNKVLRQSILQVADNKIDEIITEMGLQPDDAFVNNKNTYEKIGLLGKLIHEAGKKAGGGGKLTPQEWIDKEKEYQRQLKELKEGITKKEQDWTVKEEENLTAGEVKMLLSGRNYALPKEMPTARKIKLAYDSLTDKLAADGFKLKRSDTGKLTIVNKEGQPAYNTTTNEEITPDTYIDAALAGDKLLAINDDNNDGGNEGPEGKIPTGGKETQKGNSAVLAEIDAEMKDLGLTGKQ